MVAVYIRVYTYLRPPTRNIKQSPHLECLGGTEKTEISRMGKMALWLRGIKIQIRSSEEREV